MSAKNDRAAWIRGPTAACRVPPARNRGARALRLVLLGPPGVGKGTQAELLSERLGACPLSTGDVFRAAKTMPACRRTPALNRALDAMRKGELVSDETVLAIVRERVACLRCRGGFLLDGFPRTVAQARGLKDLLDERHVALDAVVNFDLPVETIVRRLGGRRTCEACKAVYHVETRPTRVAGVCDACGGAVVRREDDRPEAVAVRMQAYAASTAPLAAYYREQGLLIDIAADGSPEEIHARALAALRAVGARRRRPNRAGPAATTGR